jgi:RES domain
LLNLAADSAGAWPTRVGGTFALSTRRHSITQRWARHITEAFPDLDGLRYNSRFAGEPYVALFMPAADAMPSSPVLSLPLTHPGTAFRIARAAQRLGYLVA